LASLNAGVAAVWLHSSSRRGELEQGELEQGELEQGELEQGELEQGELEQGELEQGELRGHLKRGPDVGPGGGPMSGLVTAGAQRITRPPLMTIVSPVRYELDCTRRTGAAVILTSHYLADIEALCDRVMTISQGRITFNGSLAHLKGLAGNRQRVTARLSRPLDGAVLDGALLAGGALDGLGTLVEHTPATVVLEVARGRAGAVVGALERLDGVTDVSLTDPSLEETLRDLYRASP
jgi:hypothetical protein